MLNIGPKGDGSVPEAAARTLKEAGRWIARAILRLFTPLRHRPSNMLCHGVT